MRILKNLISGGKVNIGRESKLFGHRFFHHIFKDYHKNTLNFDMSFSKTMDSTIMPLLRIFFKQSKLKLELSCIKWQHLY